jgi:uroporphyrinogen-III decarboxylase
MNARERFMATCKFEPVDRAFRWESLGFWPETIERWHQEGLPEELDEALSFIYFGMDLRMMVTLGDFNNPGLCPTFDEQIIDETDAYRIRKDAVGNTIKEFKSGQSALPQFLEFPVRDLASFEEIKWRLNPSKPERLGADWQYASQVYNESDLPVFVYVCGLFGTARHLLGFENLMFAYYDQPQLLHAIGEQWVKLYTSLLEEICACAKIDAIDFWEDMAYRNGPMIGPAVFQEFMTPYYKRVIDCARSLGVEVFEVDSDGNVEKLIPLFLDVGVNMMYPFEVQAGMDVLDVRRRYGNKLVIQGGLDKRLLAFGPDAIKKEVDPKVPAMLKTGGYFPSLDHSCPPDVSLKDFEFYLDYLRKLGQETSK